MNKHTYNYWYMTHVKRIHLTTSASIECQTNVNTSSRQKCTQDIYQTCFQMTQNDSKDKDT